MSTEIEILDLTPMEQAMLDVERRWWRFVGAKEEAIRCELGLSPARYYQRLNALIDRPEALASDPMTVMRLRRLRERNRSRFRSSRPRAAGTQVG